MDITTGMVIGLFGGLGGALLTLSVQGWRDWASRRRQAAAIRTLLVFELEMIWFDLTGTLRLKTAKLFSCRTDVWDTYRQQIPNLFRPADVKAMYRAYYGAKEIQRNVQMELPLNYMHASDHGIRAVEAAIRALAGPQHTMVQGAAGVAGEDVLEKSRRAET